MKLFLTKHLTISEPLNLSIGVSELYRIFYSTDFEALKLWVIGHAATTNKSANTFVVLDKILPFKFRRCDQSGRIQWEAENYSKKMTFRTLSFFGGHHLP